MDNPSILSHVSIGTNDLERSSQPSMTRSWQRLGAKRLVEHSEAIAWGQGLSRILGQYAIG